MRKQLSNGISLRVCASTLSTTVVLTLLLAVSPIFAQLPTGMSHDDLVAKFNRACAYMSVSNEQRDRALAAWSNLQKVRDIADPIRDLANFGKPMPL